MIMTPAKQYEEYVPKAPAESSKVRKLAAGKLKDLTAASVSRDDKAAFMASMKQLNDELIGIEPVKVKTTSYKSVPLHTVDDERNRRSGPSLSSTTCTNKSDLVKTGPLRSPSFDALRKLQQLRCSSFSKQLDYNTLEAEYDIDSLTLTTARGRRRAVAHLQHPQDESDEDDQPYQPRRKQQPDHQQHRQRQQHQSHRSNISPPQHGHQNISSQQDHHLADQQRQQQRPILSESKNNDIQHPSLFQNLHNTSHNIHTNNHEDTRRSDDNSYHRSEQPSSNPEKHDRLLQALQTAGASASAASTSTKSQVSHSGGGRKEDFKPEGAIVVVPVYHDNTDDQYLTTVVDDIIHNTQNNDNDIKVYSESDECSDENCRSENESDSDSDEEQSDDEASELTVSENNSTMASISVVDVPFSVGNDGDFSKPAINQNKLENDAVADEISLPSEKSLKKSSPKSGVISTDGRLCWDDVNDTLPHVIVDKVFPGSSVIHADRLSKGENQEMMQKNKVNLTTQNTKENCNVDDMSYQSSSSSRSSKHSLAKPALTSPSIIGDTSAAVLRNRGDNAKAYELPRGATLDLSGLSYEHISMLTQGRAKGKV